MSKCIRNGVTFKRHNYNKKTLIEGRMACEHCGHLQGTQGGGVFEQGNSQNVGEIQELPGLGAQDGGVLGVLGTDGEVRVSTCDGGEVDDNRGMEGTAA